MKEGSTNKIQILAEDVKRFRDSTELASQIDLYRALNPPQSFSQALIHFALGIGGVVYVAGSGIVLAENTVRFAQGKPLLGPSNH